jgi:hypothetical protein
MSTNIQNVLAGVNLNFRSKAEPSQTDVHTLSLMQKTGSAVSTGVLETLVSSTPMVVEASPWEESATLMAYGGENQLTILRRTSSLGSTARGGGAVESLRFAHVANFSMSGKVKSLAWSPQSSADEEQTRVSIGVACSDHTVQCHIANEHSTQRHSLLGHTDYINSIAFVPSSPHSSTFHNNVHLASTSDDHTIHLWNVEQEEAVQVLALQSPGMSIKFHSQEPNLLMCGETSGDLSVFDLRGPSLVAFSMHTEHSGLLDADWNSQDASLFGCVVNKRWIIFDCRSSSENQDTSHYSSSLLSSQIPNAIEGPHSSHSHPLSKFRWSHTDRSVFATLQSSSPSSITVWDSDNPQTPFSQSLGSSRIGGITWLKDRPCLLSSSYRSISFIQM